MLLGIVNVPNGKVICDMETLVLPETESRYLISWNNHFLMFLRIPHMACLKTFFINTLWVIVHFNCNNIKKIFWLVGFRAFLFYFILFSGLLLFVMFLCFCGCFGIRVSLCSLDVLELDYVDQAVLDFTQNRLPLPLKCYDQRLVPPFQSGTTSLRIQTWCEALDSL